MSLKDTESSGLQNIDFNKFGSILKRNGYLNITSGTTSGNTSSDGLWWYEYVSSGVYASSLIDITNGQILAMNGASPPYVNITGGTTVTPGNFFTFTNWSNKVYMTNGKDSPLQWTGTGNRQSIRQCAS